MKLKQVISWGLIVLSLLVAWQLLMIKVAELTDP